jgi:hypothetical protein
MNSRLVLLKGNLFSTGYERNFQLCKLKPNSHWKLYSEKDDEICKKNIVTFLEIVLEKSYKGFKIHKSMNKFGTYNYL